LWIVVIIVVQQIHNNLQQVELKRYSDRPSLSHTVMSVVRISQSIVISRPKVSNDTQRRAVSL